MKTIRNSLKTVVLFFVSLIFLQSCVVYHKTPTTLEQAAQEKIKSKVTTHYGEIQKYSYIYAVEGTY